MKKLLVLALAATIAGVAFAGTDPVFSGTFSTYWAFDLNAGKGDQVSDDASDAMKITLNATIDDYNTVSVTVGIADALYWDDINDDKTMDSNRIGGVRTAAATANTKKIDDANLPVAGDEVDNRGDYLRMDEFTLTSDILGALGVNGPVGLKVKLGKFKFAAASVVNVAPLSTKKADGSGGLPSDIGIGLDIMILDMITFSTVAYVDQWIDETTKEDATGNNDYDYNRAELGFTLKAMGIADMIDVAAYFMHSNYDTRKKENPDKDKEDTDGNSFGISVAAALMDGLKLGVGFEYDMDGISKANTDDGKDDKGVAKAQIDVGFSMVENLNLGLSIGTDDFTKESVGLAIKFSAAYNITKALGVFGGVGFTNFSDFDIGDDASLTYDVGLTSSLGSLAILLGVSNNMDYKAPKDDWSDVVYIKFSTSF